MGKKQQRLVVIRGLIMAGEVSSHEELLVRLRDMGVAATQSTLSRDIKELGAVKASHPVKGYVYLMPDTLGAGGRDGNASPVLDNITGLVFSGNMGVIKTLPGYANAVGSVIDKAGYPFVAGTVAGNDTVFMLLTESADHAEVRSRLAADHPIISSLPE